MWDTLIAAHDAGRLQSLAGTLVRHGFGDCLHRLGLSQALARAGRVLPLGHLPELAALPTHVRVRRALEEMGPCFVKLGQMLGTRVDLFPPEWLAEFGRLQNAVPAVSFAAISAEMREALGTAPDDAFSFIDATALAAASIAQVHRARLPDGREVVIKVRRPGIKPLIEADLRLLLYAARKIETRFPDLRRFNPSGMARQFQASLLHELDLVAECRNAERVSARFSDDPRLVIPRVYWPATNERMNVQDFVDGLPVGDLAGLDAAGVDRCRLASTGAQLVLRMMLEDGFFHADPHPGNVFVLPDGRIALIDFGMVGRLSDARRAEVVNLLFGLVERDAERVTGVLVDWAAVSDVDEEQLAVDVDGLIDHYHGVPLGELNLARMLLEVTALLRTYRLVLPADLALMIKVCLTLEGLGRSLDPRFDMARQAEPFLRKTVARQFTPRALAARGARGLADSVALLAALPRELRQLLRSVRKRGARLQVQVEDISDFSRDLRHAANRVAGSLVIAALIVGSSIAMTVDGGPTLLGLPFFGFLGFIGASFAGAWLLWWIFRSGGGR